MATKGSHLLDQEDSRETSKHHRCSKPCCTVVHLMIPVCSWLATWRILLKIWSLGMHSEYRFSIWPSSIRREIFFNQVPERSWKIYVQKDFHHSESFSGFGWHTSAVQGPSPQVASLSHLGMCLCPIITPRLLLNTVPLSKYPNCWCSRRVYHCMRDAVGP